MDSFGLVTPKITSLALTWGHEVILELRSLKTNMETDVAELQLHNLRNHRGIPNGQSRPKSLNLLVVSKPQSLHMKIANYTQRIIGFPHMITFRRTWLGRKEMTLTGRGTDWS